MNDSSGYEARDAGSLQPEPAAAAIPAPAKDSVGHKIFFGADGLRAGWSLVIFLVILGLLLGGVTFIAQKTHTLPAKGQPVGEIAPTFGLYAEGPPFLMVFLATWIMSKIERRRNGVYGLGGTRALGNFVRGLAWGVTCLSLLVFTLWKSGLLVVDRRLLFGPEVLRYGIIWLFAFLLVGLLEEYLTRGYLLFTLSRGFAGVYSWVVKSPRNKAAGFWTAAIALSILFGLGHGKNVGESPIGLLSAGLAGLVFCLSLWRTGSLWWAIGFHTSWDWAQSFLYGVADSGLMVQHHLLATHPLGKPLMSGGATGPEGSIFVLPVLVLVSCIIVFTLPRESYGDATRA